MQKLRLSDGGVFTAYVTAAQAAQAAAETARNQAQAIVGGDFALTEHSHSIDDVTGLQDELDGKQATLPLKVVVAAFRAPGGGAWPARPNNADVVVHWTGTLPAPAEVTPPSTGGMWPGDVFLAIESDPF